MSDNENMTELENADTANSTKGKQTEKEVDQEKNGDSKDVKEKSNESAEESNDEDAKESGDESHNEEEHKDALFEAPVVVEGKRERKKTERLSITATEKEKKSIVFPEGTGQKLGDIPFTCAMLNKRKSDDVNLLHRCLYNVQGDVQTRKVNIRKFCGFTFEKGSSEYEKKLDFLSRVYKDLLVTQFTSIFGLKSSSKKEDMVQTILDFLMKPHDLGVKPPVKKKRSKSQTKGKETEESDKKKKTPKKKSTKTAKSEDTVGSDDSASEGEHSESGHSEDLKEEKKTPPKKKTKKAATPKTQPKSDKKEAKKPRKKKETPAKLKTPKKTPQPAKVVEVSSVSESDSDDEPLVKKIKLKVPEDDDIRDLVSKILDSSSLEDLSIRKVFQQVQDSYPGVDLSDKQKFVKTTVKELIN